MIETHAHIYDGQFDEDRAEMLKRAFDAGIEQIWMPNCDVATIKPMLELEKNYPNQCLPMMGLHPCYVDENYEQKLNEIANQLASRPFFMIGEIGLDFYWDLAFVPQQEKAFIRQLELAKQYNLAICIHSRNSKNNDLNAIQRCCDLIEEFGWKELRGIFHCFSGNLNDAKRVIGLNFKLGIGGVATFKNGGLDKVLPYIDLEHIVLETDAPYLAPVPYRGKRNEVSYIELVADRLSLLMGKSKGEIISTTTQNAQTFL
ncbi:TatD DNase family protein [Spirosomataceae bacterium TFI 002]|nr:TatD DNase family protein [Spirosomataceae bacterium TFI 002]